MKEIQAIISAYEKAVTDDLECVLATVVHVEGSAYRKAGARMLVDENGMMTGGISGGCLEGDALQKALHALHQGENKLVSYDTSDEDDAIIGAQLGCNGVIQVLFEPIDPTDGQNPVELLKNVVATKRQKAVVSLFSLDRRKPQTGTVQVYDEEMRMTGRTIACPLTGGQVREDVAQLFRQQHAHFGQYLRGAESQHAFIQLYTPPPHLVLVGAGNDAQVLSRMAHLLGWQVTVTDGRPTHANEARFVSSCQVIVSEPERLLDEVQTDARTVFVLMSHNFNYDLAVLKLLLAREEVPYIGILGAGKKYERMKEELADQGSGLTAAQEEKIYAPVGLNIGAETPAEIGLSVLAEIQMVLAGKNGKPLREKAGPIHDRWHDDFKVVQL